jgi:tagatose 6-phosphate kinase
VILCICPSPAVDITYHLDRVQAGGTNRVRAVGRRPGGKAVNVARLLHALGTPVSVLAPVGGHTGAEFADDLQRLGLPAELVPDAAPTRSTVTVVADDGTATIFVEPAPVANWAAVQDRAQAAVRAADAVVISGRFPTGAPAQALGELVRAASGAGRPTIVDTSGPPLIDALRARPTVIKPNADELAELTGDGDAPRAARSLAAEYGTTVVASLGADGVLAVTADGEWRARPAAALVGNPTGAGDALVAALARGIVAGAAWPDVLRDGVGLAAAAVLSPYAGEVDLEQHATQRAGVVVEQTGAVR